MKAAEMVNLKFTSEFERLPSTVQRALEFLVETTKPKKLILFGSRARGDYRENSDFDIVAVDPSVDKFQWARTRLDLEEQNFSLFKMDILRWDELNQNYKNAIKKEGKLLYG